LLGHKKGIRMTFDPRHSRLVAWLNLAAAIITLAGLVGNLTQRSILGPLQNTLPVPLWAILAAVVFIPSLTMIITRFFSRTPDNLFAALLKYASHPDLLKIVDADGKVLIGGHAGNFYWKEVANVICTKLMMGNLRYSNLGTRFHLQDIANGKTIEIPTDTMLEEKVTKTGLRNGQVLLVVENT